ARREHRPGRPLLGVRLGHLIVWEAAALLLAAGLTAPDRSASPRWRAPDCCWSRRWRGCDGGGCTTGCSRGCATWAADGRGIVAGPVRRPGHSVRCAGCCPG
ncbi:hypothetical protein ACWD25_47695, partial [Streptomyces sp. NPDC002920]